MGRPLKDPPSHHNNRAKPLFLRSKVKTGPNGQDVRGLSELDYRTREGKAAKKFREELTNYVGGAPNVIQKSLIERCVYLQLKCWLMDRKIANSLDTDYDSKCYLAWSNTLQRSLLRLGYKESIEIMRRRAENQLLQSYNKK